jgi:hypothetical protein
MLPKEHGAYGQLIFPLFTAFAVTGAPLASVLTGVACVALFLAHEPLVVLLGQRGRRVQAADASRAWWSLIVMLSTATASGILAIDRTPPDARWTFVIPAVGAVGLLPVIARRREKTLAGEAAVAITFAAAVLPICAGAGKAWAGVVIAAAYALLFVLGTLAVRGMVLRTRGGGNPGAARRTRTATLTLAALGAILALAGATNGLVSWTAVAAILPGVGFATALAAFPPSTARLKRVGWSLVGVTAVTALLLVAAV